MIMPLTHKVIVGVFVLIVSIFSSYAVDVLPIQSWVGKKVMMIGTHPDDIEGCVGGTIAQLTAQKTILYYLIVTNGDKGCGNPFCANWTSEQIAVARYQEQYNAAAVLNVPASNVMLLDYEDCGVTVQNQQDILENVIQQIRAWQPDVIMSWYPYPRFELLPKNGWDDVGWHPDHQAVGKITLTAQFEAGVGLLYPLLGPAHRASEFYMWEFVSPTHYLDIGSTIQQKVAAYQAHKTQYNLPSDVDFWTKTIAGYVAELVGNSSVTYAEAFTAYF